MAYNGNEGDIISKDDAQLLTANYRNSPAFAENNFIEGILYGRNHIESLLSQPGCLGIRIYFGKAGILSTDAAQLVLVGTDNNGNDMTSRILDTGQPCPSFCSSAASKL